ncbi:MAG: hypothetical protein DHS80DRAFT_21350 [Piptocephalis tieghemiana]|nr:MAG: hypothetical protein DHS80DRAFT_21350 [Piptocephalis tieghemiana]
MSMRKVSSGSTDVLAQRIRALHISHHPTFPDRPILSPRSLRHLQTPSYTSSRATVAHLGQHSPQSPQTESEEDGRRREGVRRFEPCHGEEVQQKGPTPYSMSSVPTSSNNSSSSNNTTTTSSDNDASSGRKRRLSLDVHVPARILKRRSAIVLGVTGDPCKELRDVQELLKRASVFPPPPSSPGPSRFGSFLDDGMEGGGERDELCV